MGKGMHNGQSSYDGSCGNGSPESSSLLAQQNELLSNKIQLIEKQNLEQQKRLQQLEKFIFELGSSRPPAELLKRNTLSSFLNVLPERNATSSFQDALLEQNPPSSYPDVLCERKPLSSFRNVVSELNPPSSYRDVYSERNPPSSFHNVVFERNPPSSSYRHIMSERNPPSSSYQDIVSERNPPSSSYRDIVSERNPPSSFCNVMSERNPSSSFRDVLSKRNPPLSFWGVGSGENTNAVDMDATFPDRSARLFSGEMNCVEGNRRQQLDTVKCVSRDPIRKDNEYPQSTVGYPDNCKKIFDKLGVSRCDFNPMGDAVRVNPERDQLENVTKRELLLSDDVHSIMEEFDRTAREKGLTYGMTPEGSTVDSEDLHDRGEFFEESPPVVGVGTCVEDPYFCGTDVIDSPASVFLTPSFQRSAPTLSQYIDEGELMITPQPCLTTPVLLTTEALRAAERAQDNRRCLAEQHSRESRTSVHLAEGKGMNCSSYSNFRRKANPFSNLLSSLHQASSTVQPDGSPMEDSYRSNERLGGESWIDKWKQHSSKRRNARMLPLSPAYSSKSSFPSHIRDWNQSMKLAFLSPMSDNHGYGQSSPLPFRSPGSSHASSCIRNWSRSLRLPHLSPMSENLRDDQSDQLPFCSPGSSISSHIRKWNKSLKLAYMSPLTESHCSDVNNCASEEEDLVVDEVVSLSMDRDSTPACSTGTVNTRQRTESVCSVTGPCVPPDLLLDTGRHQVAEEEFVNDGLEEQDVITEIAGILDGELPLEDDNLILPDDGIISAPLVKVGGEDIVKIELQGDDVIDLEENVKVEDCIEESQGNLESLGENEAVRSEENQHISGGFRNVAELIGNRSQSLICKKKNSEEGFQEKTVQVNGKDIKLQAGSIVLAVVNESGSLVPLPQLPMKSQKMPRGPIKVEASPEKSIEEEIDVETVTEKAPVLEAGDVDSLLAQFEASEAVNIPSVERSSAKCKGNVISQPASVVSDSKAGRQMSSLSSPVNSSRLSSQASPTHQKIKDALPKEIIEKIKASTKRKSTQMLSEPLMVRKGRGIKQQEANQPRNKPYRLATSSSQQNTTDQRVPPPLDHDYCFSPDKQKKGKCPTDGNAQSSDYLNKLPDYYTVKVSKRDNNKKAVGSPDDNHDDGGKKDSGVESGDVSDASVETEDRRKELRTTKSGGQNWDGGKSSGVVTTGQKNEEDVYDKLPPYMTDIGNVRPKVESNDGEDEEEKEAREEMEQQQQEVKKIKRKLNLSEYRQRIQSTHSSRCPSPVQQMADGTSKTSSSNNPLSLGELIQKMKDAEEEKLKEAEKSENKPADSTAPTEDVEEGELKGDSEPEVAKASSAANTSNLEKTPNDRNEKKVPFTSPMLNGSSASSSCRESRKGSSQGYASRRWSSSSHSRSRSRSRSPRRHSSRYRRSSRGKRRGTRRSSRSSGSSCRCWSRSRSRSCSRSRGRSSSECSYCSSCSDSSKSRSRSRSRSSKKKERRSYSRKYSGNWERRRRSRSWSRSSSRYSRSSRRSRSPSYRESWHSRSPYRRSFRPRREDEDRLKQVEERRVIYVGRISEGTTKAELRRRFQKYGNIVDISVHFREHGDNYGFVTYKNKDEAYNAVEHGNDDPSNPHYDLCFGGRRVFCRVQYSDLDAQDEGPSYLSSSVPASLVPANTNVDFDSLLRAAMKRKTR